MRRISLGVPSPKHLASCMGACPGHEESAVSTTVTAVPKATGKCARPESGGPRRGEGQGQHLSRSSIAGSSRASARRKQSAPSATACVRLIWKILHQGVRYEERRPPVSEEAKKVRARKMIRELRSLGYQVTLASLAPIA
jgi:hypothetical protein